MNGITVPMAVVDFIPVALFFASAVLLQRDLYSKMVKGAFALLATGSTMVLIGGIFIGIAQVAFNRSTEQTGFLGDITDPISEIMDIGFTKIYTINQDLSFRDIKETRNQIDDRGFT